MEKLKATLMVAILVVVINLIGVRSYGSDHRYKAGDQVPLYANKVGPFHNPSFCSGIIMIRGFLGCVLEIEHEFDVIMKVGAENGTSLTSGMPSFTPAYPISNPIGTEGNNIGSSRTSEFGALEQSLGFRIEDDVDLSRNPLFNSFKSSDLTGVPDLQFGTFDKAVTVRIGGSLIWLMPVLGLIVHQRILRIRTRSPWNGTVFWLDPAGEDTISKFAQKIINEGIIKFSALHRKDIKKVKKNPIIRWKKIQCPRQSEESRTVAIMYAAT